MYRHLPRHNLAARNVTLDDFVAGPLEDWIDGVMTFNGEDQFCILPNDELVSDITWGDNVYPGEQRKTVDMGTNNFLIEAYLRTAPGHTRGVVVTKTAEAGYTLDVTGDGAARLALRYQGMPRCARSSAAAINDGEWHHVVAEVDRGSEMGINLYVDGELSNGSWAGSMPPAEASLSNDGDFLVGKANVGDYFAGAIDFLRVSRGTLDQARTDIHELYEWQFNGPFLRDFLGKEPVGRRDAGAIEG
jgi:hypothetical protein